ncbi:MAG TPA: glycosyltransferase family 2 protein [Planctomycetota bacterium]|nr:glycosyltransferase family 2 protein [Planctomycetota bacterium]
MADSAADPELSIIIPLYNEESNIDLLFGRVEAILARIGLSHEIVCVNDGSRDQTIDKLVTHHRRNPSIKIVDFSRNFGKETALTAGIDYSRGRAVIPIDADLQDPPELIESLVAEWKKGFEVVNAVRKSRAGDSWVKRMTAAAFYRIIGKMSRVTIPKDTGDFRLLDRRAVDALKRLPERTRFMKGLFAWVGFKQTNVLFDRDPRHGGSTSFNYWKLWNFALDGITSFSVFPLKIWTYVGLAVSASAFVYAFFRVIYTIIHGVEVPGYASLMVVILFLGGIQLITLGVIGEYLARIYEEVKHRPLYLVRELHGIASDAPPPAATGRQAG